MKRIFVLPVFLLALVVSPDLCTAQGSVADDKAALEALYNATNGDNWSSNRNWNSSRPLDQWYGVTVNSDGRVIEIDLSSNELYGSIPVEIGNLTMLEELVLGHGQLTGNIPAEIGNLTKLKVLGLGSNRFTGDIPAEVGDLTALEYLTLSNNHLTGEIPTEIENLMALEFLNFNENGMTGKIPAEIGNLTGLRGLSLDNNQLTGNIPTEIGNLTELRGLYLENNQLTGNIPTSFSNLVNLLFFEAGGSNNVCISSALLSWHNGIVITDSLPECASEPTSAESNDELPAELTLAGNYPNPFNPGTAIDYALPQAGHVRLAVYDMAGRTVTVLMDGVQSQGRHSVRFDAGNLPTGTYLYHLTAHGETRVRKMTLLR